MLDILIELVSTAVAGIIVFFLLSKNYSQLKQVKGWNYFVAGFLLIFIAMIVDATDNFESLNRFVIIGNTPAQAIVEKLFGFLLGFILVAIGLTSWIPEMLELQKKRELELEEAKEKLKVLSGFLPICASCKNIRDDKGYWNQIETYIRDHSEAEFSHSICPDCSEKLYPLGAQEPSDQ